MENQRSIQSANFDLVNTYIGKDVVNTYDGMCGGIDVGNTCNPTGIWQTLQSCACLFLHLDKGLSYNMVV